MGAIDRDSDPELSLYIGYYGLPAAREAAGVVERLAHAYKMTRRGELVISRLEVASLLALLKDATDVIDAVITIVEKRAALVEFVSSIIGAVQAVRDATAPGIPASIREFLLLFVRPVAAGRASHAKLCVQGDNNVVLYIERIEAEQLLPLLEALRPLRSEGGVGRPTPILREQGTLMSRTPVTIDPKEARWEDVFNVVHFTGTQLIRHYKFAIGVDALEILARKSVPADQAAALATFRDQIDEIEVICTRLIADEEVGPNVREIRIKDVVRYYPRD